MLFVRRDFVSRYKQTILGPFWFILNPLISTLMYTLVFAGIAKIPTEGVPPQLFYISGIVGMELFCSLFKWNIFHFFKQCRDFWKSLFSKACFSHFRDNFIDGTAWDTIFIAYINNDLLQFNRLSIYKLTSYIFYLPLLIINLALWDWDLE